MRSCATILLALGLAVLSAEHLFAQCQRGGGGRGPRQAAGLTPNAGIAQTAIDPQFAMQRAARQRSFMQQQLALQQMRIRQMAYQQQARQAALARRHDGARQRRAAELARRERVRGENLARLDAQGQTTLVALSPSTVD